MTPRSVREYMAALAPRYRVAARSEKSRLLDEAQRLTIAKPYCDSCDVRSSAGRDAEVARGTTVRLWLTH